MKRKHIYICLMVALLVAAFLSPFASPHPDGLERVAEDKGFIHLAEGKELIKAMMPDYVFPGVSHEGTATALAGVVGTVLVFGCMTLLGKLFYKKTS